MANIERTVKILFSGSDELSHTITGINQALELFSKTVHAIIDPLAKLGDLIVQLDRSAIGYATTIGQDVVESAMSFEQKAIDLNRILGDEVGQFDQLIEGARALSREFGVAFEDVVDSVGEFKRANFDAQESLDLTREALTLVRVGFVDMGTATESLVKILKGFRADASSANEIVDILANTANTYATNVEKLAIGMGELAPIASKVGFSMSETAALATAVIEVFQSGEEAATALKTGFTRLVSESSQVEKGLEKLGISQHDANGKLKDGKTILQEIAGAMKNFSDAEQVQISAQLVGQRQAQKMVDIFTNYGKVLEIGTNALSDRQYAEKQLAEVMKETAVQLDRLEAGWSELTAAVGKEFLPSVGQVLEGLVSIEHAITDTVNSGVLKELGAMLKQYAEEIQMYLHDIARAIPDALKDIDFGPLIHALENIAETLKKVFDKTHIDTSEGLKEAIESLISVMTGLLNVTNGMLQPWTDFAAKMMSAMELLGKTDEEVATHFGNILGHAQMIDKLGLFWYTIFQTMGGDVDTFQLNVAKAFDMIMVTLTASKGLWQAWMLVVNGALTAVMEALNTFTLHAIPALNDASEKMVSDLVDSYDEWKKTCKELNDTYADGKGKFEEMAIAIQEKSKEIATSFDATVENGEKLSGSITEMAAAMKELPPKTVLDIAPKNRLQDIIDDLEKMGIKLAELPDEKVINVTGLTDEESLDAVIAEFNNRLPKSKNVPVFLEMDTESFTRISTAIKDNIPDAKKINVIIDNIDFAIEEITRIQTQLESVKETKEVKWALTETNKFIDELHKLRTKFEEGPDERNFKIYLENFQQTLTDLTNFQKKLDEIPTEKKTEASIDADTSGADDVKKALDGLPDEKKVTIKLDFDEKMYKAQTDRIKVLGEEAQKSWEIQAKLDIERAKNEANILTTYIKAEADKTIAAIEALGDAIQGVSEASADMFGALVDLFEHMGDIAAEELEALEETLDKLRELEDQIREDIDAMKKLLDELEKLTEKLAEQEDTLGDLNEELAQYQAAIKRIELGVDVEHLTRDLERVQNEIAKVEKELNKLYAEPYSAENQRRIEELEHRLKYLKREEDILKKTIEDADAAKEEFLKKVEELQRKIWELQKDIKEKQEEINDTIDDTIDGVEDVRKEWQKWLDDIDEAKRRLQELFDQGLISKEEYERAMDYWNKLEQRVREFMALVEAETGVTDLNDFETMAAKANLEILKSIKDVLYDQTEKLEKYLDRQMSMQEDLVDAQKRLIEAQIDQIKVRTDMLEKGDSIIKIEGEGLEPELEAFMWKILEKLQLRANAEFSEFLLGLRGLNLESTTGSL